MVPAVARKNVEDWLGTVALLDRRPSDANPDAKHPGKARESSVGESLLSPSDVPGLSWARSPQTFRSPSAAGGFCMLIPAMFIRQLRVQGPQDPGWGLGRTAPAFLLVL